MNVHLGQTVALAVLGHTLLFAQLGGSLAGFCNGKNDPTPCTRLPRVIYSTKPEYSEQGRKAKREGTCILTLIVEADGRARDFHVVVGLGYGLDEKAVAAVQKWKFEPAMREGKTVPAKGAVEVDFHLN